MNATRSQIITQYERAKKLGWIPHFLAAEQQHTKDYFDAADLMGIGSRETNLDPKWLKKAGDGGHGYGLLQADDRSFPGWIATGEWHNAESGIHKGAEILMMKWHDMSECAGQRVSVKGKTFTGPKLSGFKAQQAVISSYNCGRWALYAAANGKDVDSYSTGKDYSSDVIDRARIFRELLTQDNQVSTAADSATANASTSIIDSLSARDVTATPPQPPNTPDPTIEQNVAVNVHPVVTDPPETFVSKLKTWYAAVPAFVMSMLAGFWSWLQGAATEIIVAFFATAGVVAVVFIVTNYRSRNQEKERAFQAGEKQKERDFELTKLQMLSAMDRTKDTVRIVPPVVEVPSSESVN
jgi:hypothetical protein